MKYIVTILAEASVEINFVKEGRRNATKDELNQIKNEVFNHAIHGGIDYISKDLLDNVALSTNIKIAGEQNGKHIH